MGKPLHQETYDKLKKDIMSLSFKPGEPISAAKIAEYYNVSRTPAREALVMLQRENLVEIYPQSKTIVSKIKPERIRQEWFLRRTLELGMIDTLFEKIKPEDIDEMESILAEFERVGNLAKDSETAYKYLMLDNKFHAVTYRVTGQELAAEVIDSMTAHYNRLRLLIDLNDVKKERTVADHEMLLKLVKKGDKDKYKEMLGKHLGHIFDEDIDNARELLPGYFE